MQLFHHGRSRMACARAYISVLLAAVFLLTACGQYSPVSETSAQSSIIILPDTYDESGIILEDGDDNSSADLTFLFAGDIYLSEYVIEAYQKSGISGVLDEGYRRAIANADLFFANEEFPFSDRGEPLDDKEYTYRVPTSNIGLFTELGLDAVTLANNHVLDYGENALLDTCDILDSVGILHTGAGMDLSAAKEPVICSSKGKTVAIVGASRVTPDASWFASAYNAGVFSAYRPEALLTQVRELAEDTDLDVVIAYIHWGIERDEFPQEYQRSLARQLIDAGADMVIGAHPHVLQGIEYYRQKPIFYSLGNFIFGSSIPRTALLKVVWDDDQPPVLKLLPGSAAFGYTQMLGTEEKRQEFFRYMESISDGIVISDDGTVNPL